MRNRLAVTIAVVFGSVTSCAAAHAAGNQDDSPCSAESAAHSDSSYPQFFLPHDLGEVLADAGFVVAAINLPGAGSHAAR
ncbi:hypothetical protein [Paraburkholderia nodosa]|uniref:hypothetical protein n=1 Tax=Paraburkholderia nodosa TaxID=392320 RepID=UPI00114D0782|nr:hypothetical protein [Paraburkholderia nodosa]